GIKRLPSAPRLNLSTSPAPQEGAAAQLQNQWIEMARKVLADTEDVGERFAEEARRIHYKEIPDGGIRGVATADEREAQVEVRSQLLRTKTMSAAMTDVLARGASPRAFERRCRTSGGKDVASEVVFRRL